MKVAWKNSRSSRSGARRNLTMSLLPGCVITSIHDPFRGSLPPFRTLIGFPDGVLYILAPVFCAAALSTLFWSRPVLLPFGISRNYVMSLHKHTLKVPASVHQRYHASTFPILRGRDMLPHFQIIKSRVNSRFLYLNIYGRPPITLSRTQHISFAVGFGVFSDLDRLFNRCREIYPKSMSEFNQAHPCRFPIWCLPKAGIACFKAS